MPILPDEGRTMIELYIMHQKLLVGKFSELQLGILEVVLIRLLYDL